MRVAVGQVEIGDDHAIDLDLQIAGLIVALVTGQAALTLFHGQTLLGEHGDPVEALLPVPQRLIAYRLELARREAVVLRLDFLQACDVGLRFLQPFEQAGQTGLDPIYVEGGDAHAGFLPDAQRLV